MDISEKYNLTTNDTFEGTWWTDGRVLDDAHGEIVFSPGEAIELRLAKSYCVDINTNLDELKAIYGVIEGGAYVTLMSPIEIGHSFLGKTFGSIKFISNLVIVGDTLAKEDDVYHSARYSLSILTNWSNRSGFSSSWPKKLENGTFSTEIKHTSLLPVRINVPAISSKIEIIQTAKYNSVGGLERSITCKEVASIRPTKKQNLDWFMRTGASLNTLIASLACAPSTIDSIILRKSKSIKSPENDNHVSVLFPAKRSSRKKEVKAHEIVLGLRSIYHRRNLIFNSWFDQSVSKRTSSGLMHSVQQTKLPQDLELLIRVQAFEARSNDLASSVYIEKKKYKDMKARMLDSVKEDLADNAPLEKSVHSAINFGNVKSLGEKISDQISTIPKDILEALLLEDSVKFSTGVVATRNYYTHRTEKIGRNVVQSGKPLFDLIDSLRWLQWYIAMVDYKVPNKVLDGAVLTHSRISSYGRGRESSEKRKARGA